MTRQDPSLGNQEKTKLPWYSQKIIFFILSKMSTGIHAGSTFTHIYWYFNCSSSGAEKQGQVNLSSKELEAKLSLALWLSPFFLFFLHFFPLCVAIVSLMEVWYACTCMVTITLAGTIDVEHALTYGQEWSCWNYLGLYQL